MLNSLSSKIYPNLFKFLFLSFIVIAIILRIIGIFSFIPYSLKDDEGIIINKIYNLSWNNLNPKFYYYPTFFAYVVFIFCKTLSLVLSKSLSFIDYLIIGRLISAIFGIGALFVIIKMTKIISNRFNTVFFTFLFLSFNATHIFYSHCAIVDNVLCFWIILSVYLMIRFLNHNYYFFIPAISIGLATATKYSGFLLIIPLVIGLALDKNLFLTPTKSKIKKVVLFLLIILFITIYILMLYSPSKIIKFISKFTEDGYLETFYIDLIKKFPNFLFTIIFIDLIFLIIIFKKSKISYFLVNFFTNKKFYFSLSIIIFTFLLIFPYAILDFKDNLRGLIFQYRHMKTAGASSFPESSNAYNEYIRNILSSKWKGFFYFNILKKDFGIIPLFLVFLGLIYYIYQSPKKSVILLSFPLIYFIIISGWGYTALRYFLPVIPFFCIFSGLGFDFLIISLKRIIFNKFKQKLFFSSFLFLLTFISFFPLIKNGIQEVYTFVLPTTEVKAAQWIIKNIPDTKKIASEILIPNRNYLFFSSPILSRYSFESLKKANISILVIIDTDYFFRYKKEYPEIANRYYALQNLKLFKKIEPNSYIKGPVILIYEL